MIGMVALQVCSNLLGTFKVRLHFIEIFHYYSQIIGILSKTKKCHIALAYGMVMLCTFIMACNS